MMEKKEECAEAVQKKNFTDAYVAASADIIGDVSMAEGSSVWYQSVVRGDHDRIEIGEGSNIQDGCVLHADPGLTVIPDGMLALGSPAKIRRTVTEEEMEENRKNALEYIVCAKEQFGQDS